ncbi:MAG TPA: NAD+ synthase [Chromatiales bacterium]|nr:NAD+ synthase [Chromatiales bacterium]
MSCRIVMAQLNLWVGSLATNANTILAAIERARDELQADAIIFPELTLTGYPPEDLLLRPGFLRDVEATLQRITESVAGVDVIVGYPESDADQLYNSACLLRDGKRVSVYRKWHLPNYSVFDEKRYFHEGNQPCVVTIAEVPVGITICEDIWYEEPARAAADAGARLLINMNASPFDRDKFSQRQKTLFDRTRSVGLPVLYVNQVGGQDELVFDGGSLVVAADGGVVQRGPVFDEALIVVDIDTDGSPLLSPETPDSAADDVDELACVYRALVMGTRDYIHKNGFKGVVLGLSGGIDSALVLAIASDAIGADRVKAVMMPSRYSADMSLDDAKREADALGVAYEAIPIESVYTAFLQLLEPLLANRPADTTEQNLQARCRGMILMAISNREGRILLTTGNKSEMAVGYSTLYGDMAGGFAPIKDVPKQLVYQLARYRNSVSDVIPERVITRPPSAELAEDQVDEDNLPPYEVLDPILEAYVERDLGVAEIVAMGFDEATVQRVVRLVDFNEYKRRQAPPGVRITQRAFGRDRRYPITSGYRSG